MSHRFSILFGRYLFLSNVIGSGTLMAVGDCLEQFREMRHGHFSKFDWKRNGRLAIVGIGTGIINHYYYGLIDRLLPSTELKHIIPKLIADQIVASNMCIFFLFYGDGFLLGLSLDEINREFKSKYWTIYTADCLLWPPVQFINFRFLHKKYRVIYLNTMQIFYNIFLSRIKYKRLDETVAEMDYPPTTRFVSLEALKDQEEHKF